MKYVSSRGHAAAVTLSTALVKSLAEDGGLYVPASFPGMTAPKATDFASIAEAWLAPFFAGDALSEALRDICRAAFDFPLPIVHADGFSVLELFHGPTAAFKDVGARFLAECLSRIPATTKRTVLVATSGDTGGAVAAAFHNRPGFDVVVLFPEGKVSARQEKQLTAWGGNVRAFAVKGDFDDCQRMVKEAFAGGLEIPLVSANSINLGRLLPQAAYYVALGIWSRATRPTVIVPSGNLGNATGAMWARQTGANIGRVILATNANPTVSEYFASGNWSPRPTVATLANAMDVGNPSNMERVRHLYRTLEALKADVGVFSVTDEQIRETIRREGASGRVWCPHTAIGVAAARALPAGPKIVVSTAHPAKFESIVEPLVGRTVEIPPALAKILAQPSQAQRIDPRLSALAEKI